MDIKAELGDYCTLVSPRRRLFSSLTPAVYGISQENRAGDSEREALVRDNTRKLYMAATRAGQRLVITYVGDVPEAIRAILVAGSESP